MMEHKFCSVLVINKAAYVVRQANAGGPGCIVFPLQKIGMDVDSPVLRSALSSALAAYADLGRTIKPPEWDALNQQLIEATGVSSIKEYERKKREITIRENISEGTFALFGSGKGLKDLRVDLASIDEVVSVVSQHLFGKTGFFVNA